MNCPYCGKRVKDMPDHLKENKYGCKEKHSDKLKIEFADSIRKGGYRGQSNK